MARDLVFAPDEWYHCYSRGVDKRKIFMDKQDYERFLMLLYVCNSAVPIHISTIDQNRIQGPALNTVLEHDRGEPLVELGVYALMPNHYHLLLREQIEGGIPAFMHRLGTGFTMYFNRKHERTGALFSSRFKARAIHTDEYFRRVVNYIHGNPAELYTPTWKQGLIRNPNELHRQLRAYPYSSFIDYEEERPLSVLLSKDAVLDMLEEPLTFEGLLADQRELHAEEELDEAALDPIGFK